MTGGSDPRALVRPYTVTRGRTATAAAWPPETVIATVDRQNGSARPTHDGARRDLAARVRGTVLGPGEPGFREEVGAAPAPCLVLLAHDHDDIAAGLAVAAEHDLRVVVTGHRANDGAEPADDGMLISTAAMRDVSVDPARGRVRVGAGVTWGEVVAATAPHGLTVPTGWAPELTVADQALRGGLGPWARAIGFAADRVEGLEVVTADGMRRRVDTTHEIELFWALRGGAGGPRPLGVVTAVELGLSPASELWGGTLTFDGPADELDAVLAAYPDWSASLGENTTTALSWRRDTRGLQLRVAHVGAAAEGEAAVAEMRAHGPVADTVASLPAASPTPTGPGAGPGTSTALWARGLLLRELHPDVLAVLSDALADPPTAVELHHLGGATGMRPAVDDAVGGRHARYAIVLVDEHGPDGSAPARGSQLLGVLAPYASGTATVLPTASGIDLAADPDSATRARLADLADRHDTGGRFRSARPVTGRHRGIAGPPPRRGSDATSLPLSACSPSRSDATSLPSRGSDATSLASRGSDATSLAPSGGADGDPGGDGGPEAREILRLARPWRSVAEIAGTLGLPLGVVRVLVADLDDAGLVTVHRPPAQDDTDHLERVLRGLRNRL